MTRLRSKANGRLWLSFPTQPQALALGVEHHLRCGRGSAMRAAGESQWACCWEVQDLLEGKHVGHLTIPFKPWLFTKKDNVT